MNFTGKLYGQRSNGSSHGDVYTSPRVVSFMLDLIGYTPDKDLSQFRILEPSFGHGDFLSEIIRRIILSSERFGFNPADIANRNVYGCEIDTEKFTRVIDMIRKSMPGFNPVNFKNEDFLFTEWNTDFDFIIGNPPYIRYENIPRALRIAYKSKFLTFHYRCDLYVLFFEHCLNNLAPDGRHCFICSNRWTKNEYGKKLRALISTAYNLEYLIDVEGLDAFSESVSAYPAITVISNHPPVNDLKVARIDQLKDLRLPLIAHNKPKPVSELPDNLFLCGETDDLTTIEQQGFEIGIGVATGADKIFIRSQFGSLVEDELLLPIINSRDLSDNKFNWKGAYILNPYKPDGSLINLNDYPKARKYLNNAKSALENRYIVKKGRCWYALIDKIKYCITSQPKILLPDISGNRKIFVDAGNFYPAHNIYFITGGRDMEDLELLAAILMSDFVRNQIENVSTKMNGGLPRWQSQSIRRLRIPVISDIPFTKRKECIDAYRNDRFDAINMIVNEIVGQRSEAIFRRS